jgi:hypothetical protein
MQWHLYSNFGHFSGGGHFGLLSGDGFVGPARPSRFVCQTMDD